MKIILIITIIYIIICYLMFLFLCASGMNKLFKVIDKQIEKTLLPYKDIIIQGNEWINNQNIKELSIKSYDNLNLKGTYIKNPKEKYILILVHGYRSTPQRDLYSGLSDYYNMGCSILLINLRASTSQEGKYITFGYKESKDINTWVNYIYRHNKKTPIVLGGISLGATSVLMTNNKHVKKILADSAFDNAYTEIKYVINHYFHLPSIIFMPLICLYFRIFIGTRLKKVNVYSNLDKINTPILLFHGLDDDFVPHKSSMNIYNYYKHSKKLYLIKNANHGMGYLVDKDNYIKHIFDFLRSK